MHEGGRLATTRAPVSTIPVPTLGNSPINMLLSDEGILGSGVFYAVHSNIYHSPDFEEVQISIAAIL
jgi:hypothetical protein